ncbi:MAG: hypothetical protein ABWZ69_00100, partial [Mycetocola sp.]
MHNLGGRRFARATAIALGLVLALTVLVAPGWRTGESSASAADLSQFRAGNIISDGVFFNSGAMSQSQVQAFLASKNTSCDSGTICIDDYRLSTSSKGADAMCNAYSGASNELASAIIFKVAKACGINPQVLIVMLQKEQTLITKGASSGSSRWLIAMGYACPDTAACNTKYYGFFNQVYMAAWQLKRYTNPPGTSNYFTWFPVGGYAQMLYSPNANCGSSRILISNKATAALYYYTPYQPNKNAIAAGYGASSDTCAAYGNRNFFQFFTDWFGSTTSGGTTGLLVKSPSSSAVYLVSGTT